MSTHKKRVKCKATPAEAVAFIIVSLIGGIILKGGL